MTKLNQESGRSMVEMLGVLAIIGVLSIGGIAGYTMAMNRYKANELLNAASMANILAQSYNGGNGITTDTTYDTLMGGTNSIAGVAGSSITAKTTGKVTVVTGDADVCSAMVNIGGSKVTCDDKTATINFAS
ncbi:MAG: type II secretion system protein [Alphaproteobacteria bacterium]|nr:type II secretion system protein [Alphaproteobacteria bacterium]